MQIGCNHEGQIREGHSPYPKVFREPPPPLPNEGFFHETLTLTVVWKSIDCSGVGASSQNKDIFEVVWTIWDLLTYISRNLKQSQKKPILSAKWLLMYPDNT